jgi:hypothetical protein
MAKEFTKAEKKALLDFLAQLSDYQESSGCNDYDLRNTPENLAMVEAAIRSEGSKSEAEMDIADMEKDGKYLFIDDSILLDYFVKKLKKAL